MSNFFRKFSELFASQDAPQVAMTPVANLSTTLMANLPLVSTSLAVIFPQLQVNLKENILLYINYNTQRCSYYIIKSF
jgi:hypothetical protein